MTFSSCSCSGHWAGLRSYNSWERAQWEQKLRCIIILDWYKPTKKACSGPEGTQQRNLTSHKYCTRWLLLSYPIQQNIIYDPSPSFMLQMKQQVLSNCLCWVSGSCESWITTQLKRAPIGIWRALNGLNWTPFSGKKNLIANISEWMIEALGNQHHAVSLFNLVDHKKTMVFSWSPPPECHSTFDDTCLWFIRLRKLRWGFWPEVLHMSYNIEEGSSTPSQPFTILHHPLWNLWYPGLSWISQNPKTMVKGIATLRQLVKKTIILWSDLSQLHPTLDF